MANRFLNNVKINDAYVLPPTVGTTGQYIKLTDAVAGTTAWADLGQAAEVSTISYEVRNESGSSIPIGSVVYVDGGSGSSDHVTIALSDASSEATSSKTFGVTAETIANNSTGKVVLEGLVEGVDTSAFSPGQTLWLSTTAGQFTNAVPTTPDHSVFIGYAVRCQQNNGSIFVKIQNGIELGEIHDVKITTVADNEVIRYDSTLGYWVNANLNDTYYTETESDSRFVNVTGDTMTGGIEATSFTKTGGTSSQFLKADGSVDTNTYLISETDPVFSASPAAGITATDISNWNAGVGYTETDTLSDVTGRGSSTNDSITVGGLHVNSTGAIELPTGTDGERPTGVAGMFRFNTTSNQFEGYDGTQWGAIAGSGGVGGSMSAEINQYTGNGTTDAYSLTTAATDDDAVQVYLDGVYQVKTTANYSISGSTVTFVDPPTSGTAIEFVHFVNTSPSSLINKTFTASGTTADFDLVDTVPDENYTFVFVQGVYQEKSTYSITGSTLTFTTTPLAGYSIEVMIFGTVSLNNSGGIAWDSTVQTSAFTATAGAGYFVNTTSAAITVTLPSSPSAGDEVSIVDYAGTAATNNITITSSDNINGASDDVKIDYERGGVSMVYVDATQGWVITSDAGAGATATPDLIVDYLVVAGGGGSTDHVAGGGGAGGLRTSYGTTTGGGGSAESSLTLVTSTNYTVTVGGGGSVNTNGVNSVFSTITSTGGGYSGGYDGSANVSGNNGGSGGGAGRDSNQNGSAVTSPVVQGYDGGATAITGWASASGGGGAGAVGGNGQGGGSGADGGPGGDGGAGLAVNIISSTNATSASVGEVSGFDVYFAGGGGGSSANNDAGSGGIGGGGDGYGDNTTGLGRQAQDNTGGGGGSGWNSVSDVNKQGGSGVVILRYPDAYTITVGSGIIEASGSPFTEGSDKVSVFTGGTGTISFS